MLGTERDVRADIVYTYGAGRISSEMWNQEDRTGYYLYDPRGSVAGITDTKGQVTATYRYSASGEIIYGAPEYENVYAYNGESYNPNIRSQYLRARYYNVATAAFLTEDSYLGEIMRPLTLNRYGFCLGNPVNYVDPSGHWIYEDELEQLKVGHALMCIGAFSIYEKKDIPQLSEMTMFLSALHELGSANATVDYVLQYNYRSFSGREYAWFVEQMAEQRNQGYACEMRKEWVMLEMLNSDKNHTWKIKEIETYDLVTALPKYREVRSITQTDVDEINRVLNKYEINTPKWVAHFLAQCDIESALGEGPVERYKKGTNIFEYFTKYEEEGNHLGNTEPGDGTRYRGGGAIHLTGKEKYEKFSEYINDEQILTDGALYVGQKYFWESAGYFWKIYSKLDEEYDENVSVLEITEIVKGSSDLYKKREEAYNYYLKKLEERK